ncbi:MAG: 50S ribosomal protein L30 [Chitinophagales bacterium]|nr:50S ribosomal protein L30 [Chitinophagales bacterium]
MAKIKVTKIKSTIEKDERVKRTMQALGLGKVGSTNELENSPAVAGMVRRVQHLIKVENL